MKLNSTDVARRSRVAYTAQCAFAYCITLLISDAYLAKLLTGMGISDGLIGIISSVTALSCLFGLTAIPFFRNRPNVKVPVIVAQVTSGCLFMLTFLLPFLGLSRAVNTALVFLCIGGGYFALQATSSVYYTWANAHVDKDRRARFSAAKEMISLLIGIVFTLGVGFLFDKMEAEGNVRGAFLMIAVVMLALNGLSFICLMLIAPKLMLIAPKRPAGDRTENSTVKQIMKRVLQNKNLRHVFILTILYNIGYYLTIGFLGTYKTNDLLLNVGTVQLINMAGNGVRMAISIPFGAYSDRKSYAKGYCLALAFSALGFLACGFATPERKWCIVIFTVLNAVSLAGTNQNSFNMCYSYVPEQDLAPAMAIGTGISGLFGFLASLAGSRILSLVEQNGNQLFGLPLYGQQVLAFCSFFIMTIALLFGHFVVAKQSVMRQ